MGVDTTPRKLLEALRMDSRGVRREVRGMFGKEAARYTGVIMSVLVAVLSLCGIVLTPEDYEAVGVLVTALVGVFITMGGVEFIRSKVASRRTVRENLGAEIAQEIFDDPTIEEDVKEKLDKIMVYLEAHTNK